MMIKKTLKLWTLLLILISLYVVGDVIFADYPSPSQESSLQTLTIEGINCPCCRCYLVVSLRKLDGIKTVLEDEETEQIIIQYFKKEISSFEILKFAAKLGLIIDTGGKAAKAKYIRHHEGTRVRALSQI